MCAINLCSTTCIPLSCILICSIVHTTLHCVLCSPEAPGTPPHPGVIITDPHPVSQTELVDTDTKSLPRELSRSSDTDSSSQDGSPGGAPCLPQSPGVEADQELSTTEPDVSLTTKEEGAEPLCRPRGGETGGVSTYDGQTSSPRHSSFLRHGGGGARGNVTFSQVLPTKASSSGRTEDGHTPGSSGDAFGGGVVTLGEHLTKSTNPATLANVEGSSDSPSVSSATVSGKHSGSYEDHEGGVVPDKTALDGESNRHTESSEDVGESASTRERVGALLARLGRKLEQENDGASDSEADDVFETLSCSSESSLGDLAASNAGVDDLEWDSVLIARQGERGELFEDDDAAERQTCRFVYKSADTPGDLLDDDGDYEHLQQGSYYVCDDDDVVAGEYVCGRLDPNLDLLGVNQDVDSDRLSIISERTEPEYSEPYDTESDSDGSIDDPDSALNVTVIRCSSSHDGETSFDEAIAGASSSVTRDVSKDARAKLERTDTISRLVNEADISDSDDTFDLSSIIERNVAFMSSEEFRELSGETDSEVKTTGETYSGNSKPHVDDTEALQKRGPCKTTVPATEDNAATKENQRVAGSVAGDARKRRFPLLKQDTLSRMAIEAVGNDTDNYTVDLAVMVEANASFAGDEETILLDETDHRGANTEIQDVVTNDKAGANVMSSFETAIIRRDTSISEVTSLPSEGVKDVPKTQSEPDNLATIEIGNVTKPAAKEHASSGRKIPLLLRRDTLTAMALEAIEDGSGGGDEDLANMFLRNKDYVTETEVASIMGEDSVIMEHQDKNIHITHTPKDDAPSSLAHSKARKADGKTSTSANPRVVCDSQEIVGMPAKRGTDEVVDTSHAPSMSQLMKVFNQPQKFMVPKVSEAYCQKDAEHCGDAVADQQAMSDKEVPEMIQESVQPVVECSSAVEPEPNTVMASESPPAKQETRMSEHQSMGKHKDSGHVEKELHEDTVTVVNEAERKSTGDEEGVLHPDKDIEDDSRTDGVSNESSESSEYEVDQTLGVILACRVVDEESDMGDARVKVLLRVPSIVVTMADDDITSESIVMTMADDDIPSESIVVPMADDDIPSESIVVAIADDDIPSESIVVTMADDDIPSESIVVKMVDDDIPSESIVVKMVDDDIPSESIVVKMVDDDIPSESIVVKMVDDDIPSESIVATMADDDIPSESIVVTMADDDVPSENCVKDISCEDNDVGAVVAARQSGPSMQRSAADDAGFIDENDFHGDTEDHENEHHDKFNDRANDADQEQVDVGMEDGFENKSREIIRNWVRNEHNDAKNESCNVPEMRQVEESLNESLEESLDKYLDEYLDARNKKHISGMDPDETSQKEDALNEKLEVELGEIRPHENISNEKHIAERESVHVSLKSDVLSANSIAEMVSSMMEHTEVSMEEDLADANRNVADSETIVEAILEDAVIEKDGDAVTKKIEVTTADEYAENEYANVSEKEIQNVATLEKDNEEGQTTIGVANDSSDRPSKQSLDSSLSEDLKGCSRPNNLAILVNTVHSPDTSNTSPVEEDANITVGGRPTLLSMARQLSVTSVEGPSPESPVFSHASSPLPESPQSSPLASEIPTGNCSTSQRFFVVAC